MPAITKEELADLIEIAYDVQSGDPDINPATARRQMAEDLANAFELYVVGRTTVVAGVQPGASAATGIIQ